MSTTGDHEVVKLAVNLAPDVAEVLHSLMSKHQVSATEAVRRAIAVWNFVDSEITNGHKVAVIENGHLREVVIVGLEESGAR